MSLEKSAGRGRWASANRPRSRGHYANLTPVPPPNKRADAALCDTLIECSVEAERTFLAGLWLNPVNGHDAAVTAGVAGRHFTSTEHSYLFCFVCECAELGRMPSVIEAVEIANQTGTADLERTDVWDLVLEPDTREGAELLAAEAVVDFARRRQQAQEHLRRAAELGAGEDFEIVVRPRVRHVRALKGRVVA